jgi:hypothetical protein
MDVVYIGHPSTFISAKITKKGVKYGDLMFISVTFIETRLYLEMKMHIPRNENAQA